MRVSFKIEKTGKWHAQYLVTVELFFFSLLRNMSILEAIPHYGIGKHPILTAGFLNKYVKSSCNAKSRENV